METLYISIFGVAAVLAAALEYSNRLGRSKTVTSAEFSKFQNNYLLVYSLMMGRQRRGRRAGASKVAVQPAEAALARPR